MADYAVQVVQNRITASGQCVAVCDIQVVVSGETFETNLTLTVAFGASAAVTNNNILAAALTAARAQFNLTVNQGGTDRTALFGGRST